MDTKDKDLVSQQKIEQLKKLMWSGTQGPWIAEIDAARWTGRFMTPTGAWCCRGAGVSAEPDYTHRINAELAAAAVSELPSLLSEIERLNKELFKTKTRLDAQLKENRRKLENA